jgi:hypothetical protein
MNTVRPLDDTEKKFVREFVKKFCNMEEESRKKWDQILKDEFISEMISISLVNIVCNFIYHNSNGTESCKKNFEKFISQMAEWICIMEEKDKKH